jgi:DNA polymerase I
MAKQEASGWPFDVIAAFTKLKEFNPTSRDHIGWAFMTWRGWKPDTFTDTGRPKIDEGILMGIDTGS